MLTIARFCHLPRKQQLGKRAFVVRRNFRVVRRFFLVGFNNSPYLCTVITTKMDPFFCRMKD